MSFGTIIAPSILASDFSNLESECKSIINDGADWLHVDIMDGHFVPNISIGPVVVSSLRKSLPKAFLDCHLMVSDPLKWVDSFKTAGANTFTFHIEATEAMNNTQEVIQAIKQAEMKIGIAIKPKTEIDVLFPYLDLIDIVIIMTVEPGFGGQKFMPDMLPKVAGLRGKSSTINLEVDGGVGLQNINNCFQAGANLIVAGSSIFGADDPKDVILKMRNAS